MHQICHIIKSMQFAGVLCQNNVNIILLDGYFKLWSLMKIDLHSLIEQSLYTGIVNYSNRAFTAD